MGAPDDRRRRRSTERRTGQPTAASAVLPAAARTTGTTSLLFSTEIGPSSPVNGKHVGRSAFHAREVDVAHAGGDAGDERAGIGVVYVDERGAVRAVTEDQRERRLAIAGHHGLQRMQVAEHDTADQRRRQCLQRRIEKRRIAVAEIAAPDRRRGVGYRDSLVPACDAELGAVLMTLFRPGRINLQKCLAGQGGNPYWHCEL